MDINDLTYQIRGACFEVHSNLGPGLLESIYQKALLHELNSRRLETKYEIPLPILYKGLELGLGYRVDIMVEELIILELKSVESLNNIHHKQIMTYLKISKKPLGFLVNFNATSLDRLNLRRIINPYITSFM